MAKVKNIMEIFKLLDKSNCMECGLKTCLAFASAVFMKQKEIGQCPKLDKTTIKQFNSENRNENTIQNDQEIYLKKLKDKICNIDFAVIAKKTGAVFLNKNNRLTLKILGKDFSVNINGDFSADIHINSWVAVPFLNYLLYSKGVSAKEKWISFRELKGGKEWYSLFKKRCEESIKKIADTYPSLFDDIVHLFGGKQVEKQFKSDISVVLQVFPNFPLMLCYWFPEDGIQSTLNIFFDETADKNLDINSIFLLCTGLALMFDKVAIRHGFTEHTV